MAVKSVLATPLEIKHAPEGTHAVTTGLKFKSNGNGSGSWLGRYTVDGKERAHGLGQFPEVSLKSARDTHAEFRALARRGIHPKDQIKETAKDSVVNKRTVEQVVREAHAAFVPGWKNGGAGNGFMPKMEAYVFPKIGNMDIADVDGGVLAGICDPLWQDHHSIADKILKHMSKVLGYLAARKISVDRMAVKDARTILGKSRYKVTPTPAMDWEALPGYYNSLGGSMSELAERFYILSGCRCMNVAALPWSEITDRDWVIPENRMKREAAHGVPLSDQMMEILSLATAFYDDPDDRTGYVFRSSGSWVTGHVAYNGWSKKMRGAKLDATAHGMRTAFKMWGTINKVASDTLIEECLHHRVRGHVELAYLRGYLMPIRRPILQQWANYVTGA